MQPVLVGSSFRRRTAAFVAEKKNERGLTGLTQMIHSSEQQLGSSSGLVYEFQIMISTAAAAEE